VWTLKGQCEHWPIKVLKSHHNMDVHNTGIQSADVPSVGAHKNEFSCVVKNNYVMPIFRRKFFFLLYVPCWLEDHFQRWRLATVSTVDHCERWRAIVSSDEQRA
jgi:hypothetical protein